jgi:hypothetical protein
MSMKRAQSNGVLELWSYGVLGFQGFTNTPILHLSITPIRVYFLIHGGI